ncbi:MAG: TetR/AcrR family transcriptional regulator [Kofleriaceae bacterium]
MNIPTKKAYHHGNLRAALVAAALKEIAKRGPEGFSLREVARRAGVSAPAVYRHFADKDALLGAVAADCSERLGAAMQAAVAEAPEDPLEQFRAYGIAYVRFAVEHPEHFRAMAVPNLFERMPLEEMQRANALNIEQYASIRRAQEAGLIAQIPIDNIMLAASSLVHGIAHQIVEGKLGKVDVQRATALAVAATAVLGAGLAPRSDAYEDPRSGMKLKGR